MESAEAIRERLSREIIDLHHQIQTQRGEARRVAKGTLLALRTVLCRIGEPAPPGAGSQEPGAALQRFAAQAPGLPEPAPARFREPAPAAPKEARKRLLILGGVCLEERRRALEARLGCDVEWPEASSDRKRRRALARARQADALAINGWNRHQMTWDVRELAQELGIPWIELDRSLNVERMVEALSPLLEK